MRSSTTNQQDAIATVIVLCGLVGALYGAWGMWDDFTRDIWPTAPGTIVSVRRSMTTVKSSQLGRANVPVVRGEFRYTVDGQQYEGTAFTNLPVSQQDEGLIRQWIEDFPPGTEVDVYYDPDDPVRSHVVMLPVHEQSFGIIVVSLALVALGAWLGKQKF